MSTGCPIGVNDHTQYKSGGILKTTMWEWERASPSWVSKGIGGVGWNRADCRSGAHDRLGGAVVAPWSLRGFGLSLALQASMRRLAIVKRGAGGNFSYWRTSDRAHWRSRLP